MSRTSIWPMARYRSLRAWSVLLLREVAVPAGPEDREEPTTVVAAAVVGLGRAVGVDQGQGTNWLV